MGILTRQAPPLKGLILCGGKSRRMRTDKSLLEYRAVPHWQYVMGLLAPLVEETWISCREEQRHRYGTALVLPDDPHPAINGPAAGILAAHRRFPLSAWFIIACDLPLVTGASLRSLLAARNAEYPATAILNPEKGWPEPLLAIWEPAALDFLARQTSEDYNYPRKILDQCKPVLVSLSTPVELFNANTPSEKVIAEKILATDPTFSKNTTPR